MGVLKKKKKKRKKERGEKRKERKRRREEGLREQEPGLESIGSSDLIFYLMFLQEEGFFDETVERGVALRSFAAASGQIFFTIRRGYC